MRVESACFGGVRWDGDRWVGLKREACAELAEFLERLSQVHRGLEREEIDRVVTDCRKLAEKSSG